MQPRLDTDSIFVAQSRLRIDFYPRRFGDTACGIFVIKRYVETRPKVANQRPDLGGRCIEKYPAIFAEILNNHSLAPPCFYRFGQWDFIEGLGEFGTGDSLGDHIQLIYRVAV